MDIKLYACPVSIITLKTFRIINLINETTDSDGNILHLPFKGSYLEQPEWYREAVSITKKLRINYRKDKNAKR